jgi:hypothetical protein
VVYVPQPAPAGLDVDGLRRYVEEEFRRLALAYTADGVAIDDEVTALANNQFARVYLAASQTIASATNTKVNFQPDFDPSGIWDNVNKRFRPTVAGYYQLGWQLYLAFATGAAYGQSILQKNGTAVAYGLGVNMTASCAAPIVSNGTDIQHCNGTTDYIDLMAYINGGSPSVSGSGSVLTNFTISLVKAD